MHCHCHRNPIKRYRRNPDPLLQEIQNLLQRLVDREWTGQAGMELAYNDGYVELMRDAEDILERLNRQGRTNPIMRRYHRTNLRRNPITPRHLLKVITRAIWPGPNDAETATARKLAIRFLVAITPADLPLLKDVVSQILAGPANQPGSHAKFRDIFVAAAQENNLLLSIEPAPVPKVSGTSRSVPPSGSRPQAGPPPSGSRPQAGSRPASSEPPPTPSAKPSQACRSCDGRGVRKKVDKENVFRETVVTCSHCGGTGREPPVTPKKGRGGWGRRGPHTQETEEEEDINKKTDNFLERHGFGKWGD